MKTASPPAVPAPPPAEPADPQPKPDIADIAGLSGETFLRYQIGKREARTASGVVYRARDTENQRAIALKFYHPQVFADDSAKRRFLRAMRTMLPVDHPHLVKLYGAGQSRGLCFTASEFIEGESAKQLIHRIGIAGMLDWRKVWRIGVQMSRALEHAEQLGIVHRNIQPSHILVRAEDLTAKLGGLMLAKAIDGDGRSAVTQKGAIVGDLHYLAPEQVTTDAVIDSRADLYSLGATLYALLTGRPPLEGTPRQLLERIPYDAPEPIGKFHLSVPSAFAGIVQRLLAKRPDDRFESASHLTRDLESLGRFQGLLDV